MVRGEFGPLADRPGAASDCLFVNDGAVAANYDVPLGGIPVPTARLINQILHHMEREGLFDRIAQAFLPRSLVFQAVLMGSTLFLAIYAFWRVWAKRHEIPARRRCCPSRWHKASPKNPGGPARRALLNENNLWEVARSLARQCFERHGVGGPTPPEVQARGSNAERRRRRAVLALWKLAFGPPGRAVRARFARAGRR